MQFLHRGFFIFFLRGKLALYFFTYFKSLGKWKIELECVFFAFLFLEKETLAKKKDLPLFPKRGKPPKGGWYSHKTHSHGYGHRRQSRLSAGKMEWEGKGCLTKGTFVGFVWKGPAQPQSSLSWVRAPTAKPSECRQTGTRN